MIRVLCFLILSATPAGGSLQSTDNVVARVGGEEITEAHVKLVALLSGHREVTPKLRAEFIRRLSENRLVAAHLKRQGLSVSRAELSQAARDSRVKLKAKNIDLRARLKGWSLSETDLRRELEIGKLWTRYCAKAITDERIRKRFDERKRQYDGTLVRASQIFLKADSDAEWAKANQKLRKLRATIRSGSMTFAEAAAVHSEAPSRARGGDVGFFPFSGVMPREFSRAAFAISKGEIGVPIRSRFGAHLISVTDVRAGDLSPEDARLTIYRELEREEWDRIVTAETDRDAEPLRQR